MSPAGLPLLRPRPSTLAGVRMMLDTDRRLAVTLGAVSVFEGLLPTGFTLAGGSLIAAAQAGRGIGLTLGVVTVLFLLAEVTQNLRNAVVEGFRERVETRRRERVMAAVLRPPGISHLEDSEVLDLVQAGSNNEWPNTSAFTQGVLGVIQMRVSALASAAVVWTFRWWLAAGLITLWWVCGRVMRRGQAEAWTDTRGRLRRASYLRDLAFEPLAAKEVRVFGLGGWLLEGFSSAWHGVMREVWDRRRQARVTQVAVLAGIVGSHMGTFLLLARAAQTGEIGIAGLAVLAPAVLGMAQFGVTNHYTIAVTLGTVVLPAVAQLEEVVATDARFRAGGTLSPAGLPAHEIRFERIGFTYPGRPSPVYEGLDLRIEAGRSLAIVGANGAGKTTLVKLLARLYEPTHGRITVDGVDLRELAPEAWQRQVAAIFQDFVQYPLSAADNVGFGRAEHVGDAARLRSAAKRVHALGLIEELPAGWETILSRRFGGSSELSGGQWQRVALARALFAVEGGASVLVLDEPTANLDVRSEVELFDQFLEVTKGTTTILISHRFSTVRRAERIVVIDSGRVVEDGTHDELVAAGGRYAAAFCLQAGRYEGIQ